MAVGDSLIHELLAEIDASLSSGLLRIALLASLTVPDMAGALDSGDGRTNGVRYAAWFDAYAAARFSAFGQRYLTGVDCYQYRCTMLHQGRTTGSLTPRYSRTMFLRTKENNVAWCGAWTVEAGQTILIDVSVFCRNIVKAAWAWLDEVEETELFKKNSAECMELFQLSFVFSE
jgi:hypothetical protein